jgi:hypothetical protein
VTTQTDAAIIDIAGDESTPGRRVRGMYRDFQKKLLTLSTREEIPSTTSVFVSTDDLIFLGDVLRCEEIKEEYSVEVSVKHAIARL